MAVDISFIPEHMSSHQCKPGLISDVEHLKVWRRVVDLLKTRSRLPPSPGPRHHQIHQYMLLFILIKSR